MALIVGERKLRVGTFINLAEADEHQTCQLVRELVGPTDVRAKVVVNRTCTNACRVCKYILVAKWSATERR